MVNEKFEQAVQKRREAAAAKEAEANVGSVPVDSPDSDLVPDGKAELSEEDRETDREFSRIDIVDAYVKLTGNARPDIRPGQRESIKIFCPLHDDKKSKSAAINLDKQTFACYHETGRGGDVVTLGALKFGYPEKPTGSDYHEVRRKILEEFGYKFYQTPGSSELTPVAPEPEPESAPATAQAPVVSISTAPSAQLKDPDDIDYSLIREIKWKEVIPAGTFLYDYMLTCSNDSAPEMFHFWNGMLALGLSCGRSVALKDRKPVYSNLFVCLMGRSGMGKSNSKSHLYEILREALPYDSSDMLSLGVKAMRGVASGEELIAQFENPEYDPTNPKRIVQYREVRGLIHYGELTGLIGRANRAGQSQLKDTVMEILDAEPVLGTSSRTGHKIEAHEPFGSIWTSSQPKIIKGLLHEADQSSGFVNRMKLIYGTPKEHDILDNTIIDLTHPTQLLKEVHNWSAVIKMTHDGLVRWTPAFGQALADAWLGGYKAIKEQSNKTDDMLGRLDLDFKRLCLLYAINEKRHEVDADIVERVTPVLDYLIDCSNLAAESIGETVENELFNRILAMIDVYNSAKKCPTASELHQRIKKNKKFSLKMVHDTLWQMENLGILVGIISSDTAKRGPKVKRYERGARG